MPCAVPRVPPGQSSYPWAAPAQMRVTSMTYARRNRRLKSIPEDFRSRSSWRCFPEKMQGDGVEVSRYLACVRAQILRHHVRAHPLSKPETLQHGLITPPEKVLKIEHNRAHLTDTCRGSVDLGRNVSCHKLISNPFSATQVRRLSRTIYHSAQRTYLRRVQLIFADKAFFFWPPGHFLKHPRCHPCGPDRNPA
jgi:hypothetical protein